MRMTRQAKVQHHGMAIWMQQHIGWLEVEVTGVLFVQTVRGTRHRRADAGDGVCVWARLRCQTVEQVLQGVAGHMFHHEVGHVKQITRSHKTRHMRALQDLHQLMFNFKADDVLGTIA